MSLINPKQLIISNLLHAFNDAMFKMISIFYLLNICGPEYKVHILSTNGIAFAIPYIFLSIPMSHLSNRFDIKKIIMLSKFVEVACMIFMIIFSYFEHMKIIHISIFHKIIIVSTILMILGIRTCVFGPIRYLILNKLFKNKKFNYLLTMLICSSYAGILLGIISSSVLSGMLTKKYSLIFILNLIVAILGMTILIQPSYPENENKKKFINTKSLIIDHILPCKRLFFAICNYAIFMGTSIFYQLNIINYSIEYLKYDETYSGYIYFVSCIGIIFGISIAYIACKKFKNGCLTASIFGCISFGITSIFLKLGYHQNIYPVLLIFLIGVGLGMFIFPNELEIQTCCPEQHISLNMGFCNFLSFIFIIISSILLYILNVILKFTSKDLFFYYGFGFIIYGLFLIYKRKHIMN